jgi:hypothetical protein
MSVTPELSVAFTSAFGPSRISWNGQTTSGDLVVIVLDSDTGDITSDNITVTG